jgi:glycosyltransferase involved in cell wall biosynthesis
MISIIIPAYNEQDRIELALIVSIEAEPQEIVVVANGQDNTAQIVQELIPIYKKVHGINLKLVRSEKRLGKGGAFFEGVKEAKGDKIFLMDADLPVELHLVKSFAALLEAYDIVIGSRYMKGSIVLREPLLRRMLSQGYRNLCKLLFHIPIKDSQCGFKAFRRSVLLSLMDKVKTKGFSFDLELLLRSLECGFTILELPVTWHYSSGSKVGIKQALEMFKETLRIRFTNMH